VYADVPTKGYGESSSGRRLDGDRGEEKNGTLAVGRTSESYQ
jgi:hypothetical protein